MVVNEVFNEDGFSHLVTDSGSKIENLRPGVWRVTYRNRVVFYKHSTYDLVLSDIASIEATVNTQLDYKWEQEYYKIESIWYCYWVQKRITK